MILTKASVFIRTVGSTDTSAAFSIPEIGYAAFDASNFYKLEQGDPAAVFDVNTEDSYGSGSIYIEPVRLRTNYPVITYPVIAEKAGKYNVFIRVKTEESVNNFIFDILVDGFSSSTETKGVVS